ncbi:MAG: radical SAM/SPASM domain-containing protein [Bdellovibrionales bacterium]
MTAKREPRINVHGRTRLETVIPLSTPFILFVDPSSACNFRCTFCPTGDHDLIRSIGRYQGPLDFELYKKIIDDLKEFDQPLKVLRLYKDGEPLLNKRFADMVRYAKQSDRVPYVDTTTNGVYLTNEKVLEIIDAGIDRINISLNGLSDADFVRYSQTRVDFNAYLENIRFLYRNRKNCEIFIKMPGDFLSEGERDFFYKTFEPICDRISLENFSPCWPEFGVADRINLEMKKGIYGNELTDTDTCPYIFYAMSVNSDGMVSLCFLDWSRKLIIGDARKESLRSIWEGEEMFKHRLAQLRGQRKKNKICAECGQLTYCMPDNIDPYVKELEEKLIARHKTR